MLKAYQLHARLTFFEQILGTASSDPDIHAEFIASKAPDAPSREEEIESIGVDAAIEKGKTIFSKDKDGRPFIFDYQVKGFFKNAQKAINSITVKSHKDKDGENGDKASKPKKSGNKNKMYLSNYKSKIDNLVFINERQIYLNMPGELEDCQRPLRAETAQGPRVALANSEASRQDTWIEFTVVSLDESLLDNIREWLDYGCRNGIGQWHNSGAGRFLWEELDQDTGRVIGGNKGKLTLGDLQRMNRATRS